PGGDHHARVVVDAQHVDGGGDGGEVAVADLAHVPAQRGRRVGGVATSRHRLHVPAVLDAVDQGGTGDVLVGARGGQDGREVQDDADAGARGVRPDHGHREA